MGGRGSLPQVFANPRHHDGDDAIAVILTEGKRL
jgi:hypothetical protein